MVFSLFKQQSTSKTYVFSDIHGCINEFNLLFESLPLDKNSKLVFMGDYIDRGPDSAAVVSRIIEISKQYSTIALMGNHEKMFLEFLRDSNSDEASLFVINGGTATLASYSKNHEGYQIPEEHIAFYESLKLYHVDKDYIFVHAGVPNVPIDQFKTHADPSDFLWIRETFFESHFNWKKLIIHGHTPISQCFISKRRINIDTGCVYGNKLTTLELPDQKIYQVKKVFPTEQTFYTLKGSARRSERFSIDLPVMLQMHEGIAMCKAIDFSELGTMFMYDSLDEPLVLNINDEVEGMIGIEDKDMAPFKGVIRRIQKNRQAIFYGLEFTKTPFEFSNDSSID